MPCAAPVNIMPATRTCTWSEHAHWEVCKGSTLILQGEGIEVKNLWLDGSLKIKACPGAKVVVDGPRVKNSTYKWSGVESVAEGEEVDEVTAIRGFKVVPFAGPVLEFNEPGNYVVTDLP